MKTTRFSVLIGLILIATAIAPAGQPPLRDQIAAKERQELDALKSGEYEEFAALLADDAVFVDAHGTASKAEVVKHTADLRLDEFTMEDVRFVPVSSDSGLIAYKLTEKGSSHGKPFSEQVHVSALWAMRAGKWVCLFSQETAVR